jgi:hypothetical protein
MHKGLIHKIFVMIVEVLGMKIKTTTRVLGLLGLSRPEPVEGLTPRSSTAGNLSI